LIENDKLTEKQKMEKEIIELREKIKKLEFEYYEKYLKGEGD
jgi:hypothetical protein